MAILIVNQTGLVPQAELSKKVSRANQVGVRSPAG